MRKHFCLLAVTTALLGKGWNAEAQLDPEKRALFEVGYNQALRGEQPVAGYAYLYLNEPDYILTNTVLRLAIAPVYLDSELGFRNLLGPNTDVGFGIAGGGYADDYYELHEGKYLKDQSFHGHVAEGTFSVYHLFNPDQRIPLNGVFRVQEHYSFYAPDQTADSFVLPRDHSTINLRTGLRWGGRPPVFHPDLAFELAAWYEEQFRAPSGPYGYSDDREVQKISGLYWGRALLIYTFPQSKQSFSVSLTGGGSIDPDRFDAYRIGGDLPLAAEYPLVLPGYFYQELSARSFAAFTAEYSFPLDAAHRWTVSPIGTAAFVDYLPGLEQPGNFNSGLGVGVGYRSKTGMWQTFASYGYGFEAIRGNGRGGQSIAFMCQVDLDARPGRTTLRPGNAPPQPLSTFRFLRDLF